MTTHTTREMLGGLTQKEFAEKFNISLATVKNWDARDCMPGYVFEFAKQIYHWKKSYNDLWDRID